jgi:Zn-dependent protease/DNA-directed RNA polymerase subunit RPC12/RpoP
MPDPNEIRFSCPKCGRTLACDEALAGSHVECPACHESILTPQRPPLAVIPPVAPTTRPGELSTSSPRMGGPVDPREPDRSRGFRRILVPLGLLGILLAKFKTLLWPILKFGPILLKTGGTMLLTIWAYAYSMGWPFAVGFVLLILVHECGHLIAARRIGLKVGAPVFIPFMGAFIALKEAPPNAWIEAQVGIGGPLLGAIGSALCLAVGLIAHSPLFIGLAYSGFFLNLFNLVPIGFLDGGRIVSALSPWLWIVGLVAIVMLLFVHPSFLLGLILVFSLPRLFSLFRKKTAAEARYFEVTREQRWIIGVLYFGLAAALFLGMHWIHP